MAPENTVGVDNRQDIEVVVVKEALHGGVVAVIGYQLVCNVLDNLMIHVNMNPATTRRTVSYLGRDPFSSVDVAIENDGRLRVLATASPKVNTLNIATLEGFSRGDQLRVLGERRLNVLQKCQVISVGMIRTEPRQAWKSSSAQIRF